MNNFDESKYEKYSILNIPVDSIRPNPYQPRIVFDQIALQDLSNSIKEYGVMQPISVRQITEGSYELIAGERRLRASKMAGLKTIPAVLTAYNDKDSAVLALIENIQRENLNYFEEAEGFASLIVDYSLTQDEVAKRVGKSQSTVANKLRLLKLSNNVSNILINNRLTERHARALLKIDEEPLQIEILNKVIELNLNVKKTEDLIKKTLDDLKNDSSEKKSKKIRRYIKDIRLFTNTVEQAVDVMKDAGLDVNYKVKKNDDFYEINIKIPVE